MATLRVSGFELADQQFNKMGRPMIKKIVGHAGAMSLTERVYTHLDTTSLLEAINKI